MGIYVRESIRTGPFRFAARETAVDVSTGLPGYGTRAAPRANYVTMNGGGLTYRATRSRAERSRRPAPPRQSATPEGVDMKDVTGAAVHELVPTGRGDIVEQLNDAAGHRSILWLIAPFLFVAGLVLAPWGWALSGAAVAALVFLLLRDQVTSRVVVFYDVDGADERWFESLIDTTKIAAGSQRIWRVLESGQVVTTRQHKTNAGAANLINRIVAAVSFDAPRHLATNITVPTITAGSTSLHFLPDRILVKDGRHYADVAYGDLFSGATTTRFIEAAGAAPRDAQKVDRTWQYVNVKGGPDRRYSNNPERSVMLYGQLEMSSQSGLYWKVQTSATYVAAQLNAALRAAPRH